MGCQSSYPTCWQEFSALISVADAHTDEFNATHTHQVRMYFEREQDTLRGTSLFFSWTVLAAFQLTPALPQTSVLIPTVQT